MNDPHDLVRFVLAQQGTYESVLAELGSGQKRSHWMWFIFPQIEGLGHSATSRYYAIKSLDEARAYLSHGVLGARLVECCEILLGLKGKSAADIFGFPDDLKLRSSMTLFAEAAESGSVFERVLEKYFNEECDKKTEDLLGHRYHR